MQKIADISMGLILFFNKRPEKTLEEYLINYAKELDKIDYSFEGLELFDEVAKKNISSMEKIEVSNVKLGKDVVKGRQVQRFNIKETIMTNIRERKLKKLLN